MLLRTALCSLAATIGTPSCVWGFPHSTGDGAHLLLQKPEVLSLPHGSSRGTAAQAFESECVTLRVPSWAGAVTFFSQRQRGQWQWLCAGGRWVCSSPGTVNSWAPSPTPQSSRAFCALLGSLLTNSFSADVSQGQLLLLTIRNPKWTTPAEALLHVPMHRASREGLLLGLTGET